MTIVLLIVTRLLFNILFPLQVSMTFIIHHEYLLQAFTSYLLTQLKRYMLGYEIVLYICVILFLTMTTSSYVPKSQRNLLSKTFWLLTQPLRDKTYEVIDRFTWGIARARMNRRWLFSFNATLIYEAQHETTKEREVTFDTDSDAIGIDNRCSACISHKAEDFVGELKRSERAIKGFAGSITRKVMVGTLLWSWLDDQGCVHEFLIPNSYYVPHGGVRLLSPQHWAQTRKRRERELSNGLPGTGEYTGAEQCVLFWDQKKYTRTIDIDKSGTNVATMRMAPGFNKFHAFCVEAGIDDDWKYDACPIIASQHEVTDDEKSQADEDVEMEDADADQHGDDEVWTDERPREFNLAGPDTEEARVEAPKVIVDEEDRGSRTATSELLQQHYKFGHISFEKLQKMAEQGILPKRLAKCNVPSCSACLYAKATRRQWRNKTRQNANKRGEPLKPGDVISVDQMVSQTPGLIAQMTGFLTKK